MAKLQPKFYILGLTNGAACSQLLLLLALVPPRAGAQEASWASLAVEAAVAAAASGGRPAANGTLDDPHTHAKLQGAFGDLFGTPYPQFSILRVIPHPAGQPRPCRPTHLRRYCCATF